MAFGSFSVVLATFYIFFGAAYSAEPRYVSSGGSVSLRPVTMAGTPTDILWTHNKNKVVEWDPAAEPVYREYNKFRGVVTLNTTTGELTIRGLTAALSGSYEIEYTIDNRLHRHSESVVVLDPASQPEIRCERFNNNTMLTLCCSSQGSGLQYRWSGPGLSKEQQESVNITTTEEGVYTCEVTNHVSQERRSFNTTSECAKKEGNQPTNTNDVSTSNPIGVAVGVAVVAILVIGLVIGLVVYFRRCQRLNIKKSSSRTNQPTQDEQSSLPLLPYTSINVSPMKDNNDNGQSTPEINGTRNLVNLWENIGQEATPPPKLFPHQPCTTTETCPSGADPPSPAVRGDDQSSSPVLLDMSIDDPLTEDNDNNGQSTPEVNGTRKFLLPSDTESGSRDNMAALGTWVPEGTTNVAQNPTPPPKPPRAASQYGSNGNPATDGGEEGKGRDEQTDQGRDDCWEDGGSGRGGMDSSHREAEKEGKVREDGQVTENARELADAGGEEGKVGGEEQVTENARELADAGGKAEEEEKASKEQQDAENARKVIDARGEAEEKGKVSEEEQVTEDESEFADAKAELEEEEKVSEEDQVTENARVLGRGEGAERVEGTEHHDRTNDTAGGPSLASGESLSGSAPGSSGTHATAASEEWVRDKQENTVEERQEGDRPGKGGEDE